MCELCSPLEEKEEKGPSRALTLFSALQVERRERAKCLELHCSTYLAIFLCNILLRRCDFEIVSRLCCTHALPPASPPMRLDGNLCMGARFTFCPGTREAEEHAG